MNKKITLTIFALLLIGITILDWYDLISHNRYDKIVFFEMFYNCQNCYYVGILDSIFNIIFAYILIILIFNIKTSKIYKYVKDLRNYFDRD